jgi:hypothetical protein
MARSDTMADLARASFGWLTTLGFAAAAVACSGSGKPAPGATDAPAAPNDAALADSGSSCGIGSDAGVAFVGDGGLPMFPSAETVNDNATVMAAVAAVQKLPAGSVFLPTLDDMPPDITGTWDIAQGAGKLIATSDGPQSGTFAASEAKVSAFCHDVVQDDAISTANGMKITSSTSLLYLRGSGQSFTTYGVTIGVCADVPFAYIEANITAGTVDRAHGKVAYDSLLVTLDTQGAISATCASHLVHALQKPGGWALISANGTLTP